MRICGCNDFIARFFLPCLIVAARTGVVRIVRESVGRGAGDTRTAVHPPVVLLPPAASVETYALEELPARDVVLHLLLYAAGRVAGEFSLTI